MPARDSRPFEPAFLKVMMGGWRQRRSPISLQDDETREVLEELLRLGSRIDACAGEWRELFDIGTEVPTVYCGYQNPCLGENPPLSYVNEVVTWGISRLALAKAVRVGGTPSPGSDIFALGSPISTGVTALAENHDPSSPLRRRLGPPLNGTRYLWEFEDLSKLNDKPVYNYDTVRVEEYGWGLKFLKNVRTGDCELLPHPSVYHVGETEDARDAGFVKTDVIVLKHVRPRRGRPITSLPGGHGAASGSFIEVLGSRRLHAKLKEDLRIAHLTDKSFEVPIYVTKVRPIHARTFMKIREEDLELGEPSALGEIDERLLSCYRDPLDPLGMRLESDALLVRALICRGARPAGPVFELLNA